MHYSANIIQMPREAGIENQNDDLAPERRAPAGVRFISWGVVVAAITCSYLYLRGLKTKQESSPPAPPSIEQVRTTVERTVDADASKIIRAPLPITLAQIKATRRPADLVQNSGAYASKRAGPFETQIWLLRATIDEVFVRADGDYYLVVESDGLRGVVEVPDPSQCKGSPFLKEIKATRLLIDAALHPTVDHKEHHIEAEFTGVGYFGTAGKNENGARLMPLVSFQILKQ